jgi:hypothetical protein
MIRYKIDADKWRKMRAVKLPNKSPMEANREFCAAADIDLRSLFEYTRGHSAVNGSLLVSMMDFFGCTAHDLVSRISD